MGLENSPHVNCSPRANPTEDVSDHAPILPRIPLLIDDDTIALNNIFEGMSPGVERVPKVSVGEDPAHGHAGRLQPEDVSRLLVGDVGELRFTKEGIGSDFLSDIPDVEFDPESEHLYNMLARQFESKSPQALGDPGLPYVCGASKDVCGIVGSGQENDSEQGDKGSLASNNVESLVKCRNGKAATGSARQSAAERQRRYRERKKKKNKEIEAEVAALRAKAEALKLENGALKQKQEAMCSVLETFYDSKALYDSEERKKSSERDSHGRGNRCSLHCPVRQENVAATSTSDCDTLTAEASQRSIELIYGDVLSDFDRVSAGREQVGVVEHTIPPDSMYLEFLNTVDRLLKKCIACSDDPAERQIAERDLGLLFELRTKALADIAAKHPELVLRHLVDGWVGEIIGEGTLPDNPMAQSFGTLGALIKEMNLTADQMSAFCTIWKEFVTSWNNEVTKALDGCVAKLPDNPSIQESVAGQTMSNNFFDIHMEALKTRGMYGALEDACYLQMVVEQDLSSVSQNQAYRVLELGQKIFSLLSPIQKGRLWLLQFKSLNERSQKSLECQQN